MLSRTVKRTLLDSRWPMPPPFLLPWAAHLTTTSHTIEPRDVPPPPQSRISNIKQTQREAHPQQQPQAASVPSTPPPEQAATSLPVGSTTEAPLSSSLCDLLPLLKAQTPHYITIHIHGKPYLVTAGDTIRLPFLMHGVEPGDVLRLNRAINIGSRDYTLKAAAAPPELKSPTMDTQNVIGPTTGTLASHAAVMPEPASIEGVPHFVPHIAKGKHSYIDERLFVCRAVVMGVDSEPMRIKEKTKQRQRKVKKVKSKHRFTILKVKEVTLKGIEELEESGELD